MFASKVKIYSQTISGSRSPVVVAGHSLYNMMQFVFVDQYTKMYFSDIFKNKKFHERLFFFLQPSDFSFPTPLPTRKRQHSSKSLHLYSPYVDLKLFQDGRTK